MSCEKRGKVWRVSYRYNGVVYKETFDTEKQARARSGKLKLDTEGVIFVQKMYNGRQEKYISGQGQT